MKRAAIVAALAGACACGPRSAPPPPRPTGLPDAVVYDFEHATLQGFDAWVALFDFPEVGAFEILLRRYDLLGRVPDLSDDDRARLAKDDGTPFPPARERRNVSRFYALLAQRTVGTGGCTGSPPIWSYNRLLGVPFEPLPPGNEHYAALRDRVNAQLARGGVIAIRCKGGKGGVAVVYSQRPSPRGYDLITIYDEGEETTGD